MSEHEIPEHAQMIIMPSELKTLKSVTDKDSTKDALSEAVTFTIKHKDLYKSENKK